MMKTKEGSFFSYLIKSFIIGNFQPSHTCLFKIMALFQDQILLYHEMYVALLLSSHARDLLGDILISLFLAFVSQSYVLYMWNSAPIILGI